MQQVIGIATLIVIGAILADAIVHGDQTASVLNAIGGLWKTGLNATLGQAS